MVLTTGNAAVFQEPQSAVSEMVWDPSSSSISRCSMVPRPSVISVSSSSIRLVPSRQGYAFAAGFVLGKIHEEARNLYHTAFIVHDHQTAGADHGAYF